MSSADLRRPFAALLAAFWIHAIVAPCAIAASAPSDAAEENPAPTVDTSEAAASSETPEVDAPLTPFETAPALVPKGGLDERVSLDLRNIDVTDALRFLALKGGLNMAVSKNVSGRVQLLLNDVPIRDVLDLILITNQLAMEKIGDVYHILTEQEYKERFGRKFGDARQVRVFKLRYAIPEQAFALFEVLKSEIGRLLVDPESGTVLVMDTVENIKRMESALVALEERKSVKVYNLKYAKALDVEARLKTKLDNKKVGSVTADERTNSVIVETLPERIHEIDSLVASLDQKSKEVLIDAKIISVNITDDLKAEIRWDTFFRQVEAYGEYFAGSRPPAVLARTGQSALGDFVNITPTATPVQFPKSELTSSLFFGMMGEDNLEVLLNFLKTLGNTKVLSNPKIAVLNNQEAKILVGQKQAYVTTTTTTGQTTSTTAESVTFIDVGIQFAVTPTINDDGFVTMKIKPEVSSVIEFLTTPSGNRIPIVDSSRVETSVMVKDGVSIVIGGLRKDTNDEQRRKIPILGDIPILGKPFNSFTTSKRTIELVIILTPHIIYGDKLVTGVRKEGRLLGPEESPYLSYVDYAPVAAAQRNDGVKPAGVSS